MPRYRPGSWCHKGEHIAVCPHVRETEQWNWWPIVDSEITHPSGERLRFVVLCDNCNKQYMIQQDFIMNYVSKDPNTINGVQAPEDIFVGELTRRDKSTAKPRTIDTTKSRTRKQTSGRNPRALQVLSNKNAVGYAKCSKCGNLVGVLEGNWTHAQLSNFLAKNQLVIDCGNEKPLLKFVLDREDGIGKSKFVHLVRKHPGVIHATQK